MLTIAVALLVLGIAFLVAADVRRTGSWDPWAEFDDHDREES